jgi:hypothetical protein
MGAQVSPQAGDNVSQGRNVLATGYYQGDRTEVVDPMATREQLRALLAVACPWCGAAVQEPCSAPGSRSPYVEGPRRTDRRPIRTLDGGSHDARWRRALGEPAPVRAEVVIEEHRPGHAVPVREAEPELVGAGDRPW